MGFYWKRSPEDNFEDEVTPLPAPVESIEPITPQQAVASESGKAVLDEEKLMQMTQASILEVVNKVVPELAEKIIREELNKLLQEQENPKT